MWEYLSTIFESAQEFGGGAGGSGVSNTSYSENIGTTSVNNDDFFSFDGVTNADSSNVDLISSYNNGNTNINSNTNSNVNWTYKESTTKPSDLHSCESKYDRKYPNSRYGGFRSWRYSKEQKTMDSNNLDFMDIDNYNDPNLSIWDIMEIDDDIHRFRFWL